MPDNSLKRLAQMRKKGNWLIASIESVQESTGPSRGDPGWFHPSGLGHTCDARLAFEFLGAPSNQTITARLQRIFDLGNARDLALKKATKKAGVSLIKKEEDRKIVIPSYRIRGELDDWVLNPVTGRKAIVDYKTMNHDEFEALEAVKPSHHVQVHPYMFAKETYEGLVLYEDKNTQTLKIHEADFNNQTWGEITSRLETIIDGIRKGYVKRTPIANESSCPFYNICSWANIDKLREESQLNF